MSGEEKPSSRARLLALAPSLVLAALGGALYFLGFVGFGYYPLTWICFLPVLLATQRLRPRQALLVGVVFGLVTNLGGYYWVVHLLQEFAYLPLPLAFLGYLLLCLYQGFLLALLMAVVRRLELSLGLAPVWGLALCFPALERIYPLLFPSYIGNSQYRFLAITQLVELTGMAGLTALIALVNGALYELVSATTSGRPLVRRRLLVPAALFGLALIYGTVRIPQVDEASARAVKRRVAIVQTNLGAREKWAKTEEFVRRHQEMSLQALAQDPAIELFVWPESAYTAWISRDERNLAQRVTRQLGRPVIFGALTYQKPPPGQTDSEGREPEPEKYNTLVATSSSGDVVGLYDKIELLAFGETLPLLGTFPSLGRLFPRSGFFTHGRSLAHVQVAGARWLPNICYEDILPDLVRRLWQHGGPADALVNITNDSWYGDTHEPLIHLVLATFRSIETRRALVRSTNTGISALVDPVGRITARTGQWTRELLVVDVPLIQDGGGTLFLWTGDVLGWSSAVLMILLLLATRRLSARPE